MHGSRKRNPTIQTTVRVPVKTKEQLQHQMMQEIRGKTKWIDEQLGFLRTHLVLTELQKDSGKLEQHLQAIMILETQKLSLVDEVYEEYQIVYGKRMFPDKIELL